MPSGNFRFKVRPRKDQIIVPCAPELTTLLACFATSGDLRHTTTCAESAKALQVCMSNRHITGGKGKSSVSGVVSLGFVALEEYFYRDWFRVSHLIWWGEEERGQGNREESLI